MTLQTQGGVALGSRTKMWEVYLRGDGEERGSFPPPMSSPLSPKENSETKIAAPSPASGDHGNASPEERALPYQTPPLRSSRLRQCRPRFLWARIPPHGLPAGLRWGDLGLPRSPLPPARLGEGVMCRRGRQREQAAARSRQSAGRVDVQRRPQPPNFEVKKSSPRGTELRSQSPQ